MKETEFRILMHLGKFVDENLLDKGIYACNSPYLHPEDATLEKLIQDGLKVRKIAGDAFLPDSYFENLKKCDLVPISIMIHDSTKLTKCPCCGSEKTYLTEAIHCKLCASTTEI